MRERPVFCSGDVYKRQAGARDMVVLDPVAAGVINGDARAAGDVGDIIAGATVVSNQPARPVDENAVLIIKLDHAAGNLADDGASALGI